VQVCTRHRSKETLKMEKKIEQKLCEPGRARGEHGSRRKKTINDPTSSSRGKKRGKRAVSGGIKYSANTGNSKRSLSVQGKREQNARRLRPQKTRLCTIQTALSQTEKRQDQESGKGKDVRRKQKFTAMRGGSRDARKCDLGKKITPDHHYSTLEPARHHRNRKRGRGGGISIAEKRVENSNRR